MKAREEEAIYWRVCVAFAGAAPLACAALWLRAPMTTPFFGIPTSLLLLSLIVGSVGFAILLSVLTHIALQRPFPLRFWVVEPKHRETHRGNYELVAASHEVIRRFCDLGFKHETSSGEEMCHRYTFAKLKAPQVFAYADHAFTGEAVLQIHDGAVDITVRLTMRDTSIVTTGEALERMARYLALAEATLNREAIPLNAQTGMASAFVAVLVALVNVVTPTSAPLLWALCGCALLHSVSWLVIGTRAELIGGRLSLLSVSIALLLIFGLWKNAPL